jgi:transposase
MNKKTTKATCVFPVKRNGKPYRYMVRTIVNGTKFYVGCYKTQEQASKAYESFIQSKPYKDAVARGRY